jgi:membrane protein YqaA with SNARE-associated domain
MASKRPSPALLWLTMIAAPGALAVETLLRWVLFPPEFEQVRELLHPFLTPVAWALGGVAALASLGGLALQRRMAERRIARAPDASSEDARYREVFGVFLLTASVPQVPALLSTFAYMFGASVVPVLIGIAISSVGVVSQALRVSTLAQAERA